MTKTSAAGIIHASTLDFFLEVLGLADSAAGSGDPGGSVGGLGAFATSGSGSRGMEGPLENPEKNPQTDTNVLGFVNICRYVCDISGSLNVTSLWFYYMINQHTCMEPILASEFRYNHTTTQIQIFLWFL